LARLARIEPNDRTTLGGECETFRLAIHIAEPPRIKERSGAATRREIIDPRYRGRLVAGQIAVTIWTFFEVAKVGAGLGQCFVGKPDCERDEPVRSSFIRHRSPSARAPPRTKPADRECGGPNSMKAAGFFSLATSSNQFIGFRGQTRSLADAGLNVRSQKSGRWWADHEYKPQSASVSSV
jgi:hypothetical protein